MMLAQSLGEYGFLAGIAEGVTRLSVWADGWMGEWGFSALIVGGLVAVGWVGMKLLGR